MRGSFFFLSLGSFCSALLCCVHRLETFNSLPTITAIHPGPLFLALKRTARRACINKRSSVDRVRARARARRHYTSEFKELISCQQQQQQQQEEEAKMCLITVAMAAAAAAVAVLETTKTQ